MEADLTSLFNAELRRLIEQQLAAFDASMSSPSARSNWLGERGGILSETGCREALRSKLKAELASLCLGIADALDGATAMSDKGQRVFLADAAGQINKGHIHDTMMDYFEAHLF